MTPRDLIATARSLAEGGPRRPSQASLRRAVSTAYYAMFHCLAGTAADLLIGGSRGEAWHQAYRALEHGKTRNACRHRQAMQRFPTEIRDFAEAFVMLQDRRHEADYALEGRYDKLDVLSALDGAEYAIAQFEQADVEHRRGFAAHVLFRQRSTTGGPR